MIADGVGVAGSMTVPVAPVCMSCGDAPSFSTEWWDGFEGRLIADYLCGGCADDAVKQGSEIGVDIFPMA